jgi:hypothetical protein
MAYADTLNRTSVAETSNQEVSRAKPRKSHTRKSHIAVMLASLATGSAATVTVLDSWDKVMVDLGLKKSETVVLAEEGQQGVLLRHMVHMISERVFWTTRYSDELADGFPQADLNEAWRRYNDSVVTWNESYLLNKLLTAKFFSEESQTQLNELNSLLVQVNTCLNKIHYPEIYKKDHPACSFNDAKGGSHQENIGVLENMMKQVYAKRDSLLALLKT